MVPGTVVVLRNTDGMQWLIPCIFAVEESGGKRPTYFGQKCYVPLSIHPSSSLLTSLLTQRVRSKTPEVLPKALVLDTIVPPCLQSNKKETSKFLYENLLLNPT